MFGACNVIRDNDTRCGSLWNLHLILFLDPSSNGNIASTQACKICYDRIINEINETVIKLKRKHDNLVSERNREIAIAKQYGSFYSGLYKKQRIDDLRTEVKRISLQQCRNVLCMKNLQTLDKNAKLYSVSTYKPNGRRHHTFYVCSFKCFTRMKGIFGITPLILNKQTTFT